MKYEFEISFSHNDGCSSWTPNAFEASSVDEVCNKLKTIMDSDYDGYGAEDIMVEGYTLEDDVGELVFEYQYETKFRHSSLREEENKMFDGLRKELTKLFSVNALQFDENGGIIW